MVRPHTGFITYNLLASSGLHLLFNILFCSCKYLLLCHPQLNSNTVTGRQIRPLKSLVIILQHSSYATKTIINTVTISTLDFHIQPIQMIHYWSNTLYSAHQQWKEKMSTWDQVCSHKDISYRNQDQLVRFSGYCHGNFLCKACMRFVRLFSINTEQPMFGFRVNSTAVLALLTGTLIVSLCNSWTPGNFLLNFLS